MRTTITLSDDVHERALQAAFIGTPDPTIRYDPLTGFPCVEAGRGATSEEVRALEDDERRCSWRP